MSFMNAGIIMGTSVVDITEDQLDALFGVHVKGVAFGLKHQVGMTNSSIIGIGAVVQAFCQLNFD